MKYTVLFTVLMLFAVSSNAAEVKDPVWETYAFQDGVGALSISDQPCSVPVAMEEWEKIRAMLKARFNSDLGEVKQSRLLWYGKVYAGCYAIGPDNGRVYNIDSTGEKLWPPVPRESFLPHEGALPVGGKRV